MKPRKLRTYDEYITTAMLLGWTYCTVNHWMIEGYAWDHSKGQQAVMFVRDKSKLYHPDTLEPIEGDYIQVWKNKRWRG